MKAEEVPAIPPALAAEIAERVLAWRADPAVLDRWLEDQLMTQLQINAAIASGRLEVHGKGGPAIMARALRDFGDQAARVLEALRRQPKDE